MSKIDDLLNFEEEFHINDKKESRAHRKILSSKDRSKYKKTDEGKNKKQAPSTEEKESLKMGRVLNVLPETILVASAHQNYICNLKGSFKHEKTKIKNLIAVGDIVYFEDKGNFTGHIQHIAERYSILSRADHLRRNKEQIIAVNIDQVLIVASIFKPTLKPSLVDRYIIAATKGNMKPIIVLNKIDFVNHPPQELNQDEIDKELSLYHEFVHLYRSLGITLIEISATSDEGIKELERIMEGKASVFSGQSGVGKTSLINKLLGTNLKTQDIVAKTHKGSHTTTMAQLIPLANKSGFCIDTPGIRSFGMWKLDASELQHYFHEFSTFSSQCKFPNCSHTHEPGCAVISALENGEISTLRYNSYLDLLHSLGDDLF